jgi:NodT family efflux transporter outer membrane factor (OMF) lipoprotein
MSMTPTILARLSGRLLAGLAIPLTLAGCVVGPNYAGPPVVVPQADKAQAFNRAGDAANGAPPGRWWLALNDADLTALIEAALASSPDAAAARARVRQARATLRQQKAGLLPTTSTTALALGSQGLTSVLTSSEPGPVPGGGALDLYSVGFDATWELDLFGGQARAVEGARAQAEAYQDDLEGAVVSLTAEVAEAYIELRDDQQQLVLSQRNAEIEARALTLEQRRRAGGAASDLDVERLNTQLQNTRAILVPLSADIVAELDRLAVLTAQAPGALDARLTAPAAPPAPPAVIAVGDPGALLRRRPDVRAAERRLAQQNALIGQRTADLFPKVSLLGEVGFMSTDPTHLFEGGSLAYAGAPILQWSPFDFGRVRAKIGQAAAQRDLAEATYRKTVLGALDDAETALARYAAQRNSVVSLERVKTSADRAAAMENLRVQGGTAALTDMLDVEARRVAADLSVEQAKARLSLDFVALQKSLGLGWVP